MKTLYAITHIDAHGMRALWRPNQGRNHYATIEQAEEALALFKTNNSPDRLGKYMQVRPVQCYDHGDAMGVYFDSPVLEIVGTQWGGRYGMEFTGYIKLDGEELARVDRCERGCDSYLEQRLVELAQEKGHFPGARFAFSAWFRDNGYDLRVDIRDVRRKKDMI